MFCYVIHGICYVIHVLLCNTWGSAWATRSKCFENGSFWSHFSKLNRPVCQLVTCSVRLSSFPSILVGIVNFVLYYFFLGGTGEGPGQGFFSFFVFFSFFKKACCIWYKFYSILCNILLLTGSILEHGASFMEMAGKDSLSLNVEFIRVNISRTRKMEIFPVADNSCSKLEPQIKSTVVRFSGLWFCCCWFFTSVWVTVGSA